MGHVAHGDATGGLNGAAALLVALLHRAATREGQHIDLAQVECMLPLAGPALLYCSATGETPLRSGNRHPDHVPHGIFAAAGEDRWIAVAVTDDAMWQRCTQAIGRPDLARMTVAQRRAREDELEAAIGAWTRGREADAAMAELQRSGVAAGTVRPPIELFADLHLSARGFWQYLERPFVGKFPQSSLPFRETPDPYPIRSPAPTLGQHTSQVLHDLLGYSTERLSALAAQGITGTEVVLRRATRNAA
jgi:crotonobetainyl-CoA:carnitine CoA-transferase CaiB-like acyl-CoA transferase